MCKQLLEQFIEHKSFFQNQEIQKQTLRDKEKRKEKENPTRTYICSTFLADVFS